MLLICVTAGRSEPICMIPREVIVGVYVVRAAVSVTQEECIDDKGEQPEDDRA